MKERVRAPPHSSTRRDTSSHQSDKELLVLRAFDLEFRVSSQSPSSSLKSGVSY